MTERLYHDIAGWWLVISPPAEYAEEAELYVGMIRTSARRPVREVLELGSGGGNNASHMKHAFGMTLVEPSDEMRENTAGSTPSANTYQAPCTTCDWDAPSTRSSSTTPSCT